MRLCAIAAAPALAACGGPDITGEWEGTAGSEGFFLELEQDGDLVEGEACEAEGKDCSDIQDGELVDNQLTFFYEFSEGTERVTVELDLSDDEEELTGEADSTKCGCTLDVELERD